MVHPFLSSAWLEAVERERTSVRGAPIPRGMEALGVNLTVADAPPGVPTEFTLVGAPAGFRLTTGSDGSFSTMATIPYDVAYALFVEGSFQTAMMAFVDGRVTVDGDLGELLALEETLSSPTPQQRMLLEHIQRITDTGTAP